MDEKWEPVFLSFRAVTLMDGSVAKPGQIVMKKKDPAGTEYRLPTEDEESDYMADDAW